MAIAAQIVLERGQVRVFSRNDMIGAIVIPLLSAPLPASAANLQSLMVRLSSKMAMAVLISSPSNSAMRGRPHSIVLYAFDLLHSMARTFAYKPCTERRDSLKHLVGTDAQSRIQFSDEFDGDGDALFKACAEKELEGILSKHSTGTLSVWPQQDLAQDQVLH